MRKGHLLGPSPVPPNFLQILYDAVNYSMEKAAENKGIPVQELFMIFQESGWKKDATVNQMQLEAINRKYDSVAKVTEDKVDNEYKQECLAYVS
jgi:hypothetical protein